MTSPDAVSIRAVETLEEMAHLSGPWNALLAESGSRGNVFLTWEWLYTWAKHYIERDRLWILLVYRGENRLLGIAPFYIRKVPWHCSLALREILFLGTGEVCSSYLDFIVAERDKRVVLTTIFQYLHGEARRFWDAITLAELPAESSSLDIWDGLIQNAGKVSEITDMNVSPIIELGNRIEDFTAAIGAGERYNLQRKQRRLALAGEHSYERASSQPALEEALGECVRLHQTRWTRRGATGAFGSPRFLEFHREIVRLFSERRWVHFDFLLFKGQKIAAAYGFTYNGRCSYYLPGFDPDFVPKTSPGILLLFRCIEQAIQEGCKQFDLLRGWADYKLAWATNLRRSLILLHYNRTWRAAAGRFLESVKDTLKIAVR